jgi:hypothetical protein
MKSSADSISNGALVSGRVAVPILPSGSPVLKKNGVALAGVTPASTTSAVAARAALFHCDIFVPLELLRMGSEQAGRD